MVHNFSPSEEVESQIQKFTSNKNLQEKARKKIKSALLELSELPEGTSSFTEIFEQLVKLEQSPNSEVISTLVIRLISCDGLLPQNIFKFSGRHLIKLIEKGNKKISSVIPKGEKFYEPRLEEYVKFHSNTCDILGVLSKPISNWSDLISRRHTIMRAINNGNIKIYLNPLGYLESVNTIDSLYKQLDHVNKSETSELHTNLLELLETTNLEIQQLKSNPNFFIQDYVLPFLKNVENKIKSHRTNSEKYLDCDIVPPSSNYVVPKKYPLHNINKKYEINIPLNKKGSGKAINAIAKITFNQGIDISDEIPLVEDSSKTFLLPLRFSLDCPCKSLEFIIEIKWDVYSQNIPSKTCVFEVKVLAQKTDINWDILPQQPYSLHAVQDEHFYGRKDTLEKLIRFFKTNPMQSCYITGQKRVGKSSLAKKVESELNNSNSGVGYHILYLDTGDIHDSNGSSMLQNLGKTLESFISELLPRHIDWECQDYSTSLSPLINLLKIVRREQSNKRIVVIIDEFDEIHKDLYLRGELAKTFFLNMRTLSSKRDVAFLLVGGEKMSSVMSSQGERLNRFSSVKIDSFNLHSEWQDYSDLIRKPVENIILVHEDAILELFKLTNGNPYFTKELCQELYIQAVKNKDAEFSYEEVKKVARIKIDGTLDAKTFAHYWDDGIPGDEDEKEIESLNRRRILIAWAHSNKSGKITNYETILQNLNTPNISSEVVKRILVDFCRRDIFQQNETDQSYTPKVRLFGSWLSKSGHFQLISDFKGDELTVNKIERENKAEVTSNEIVDLISNWDLYDSKKITPDEVRIWLDQVNTNVEKRILFKLLLHTKFVGDPEIEEKVKHAHLRIEKRLPNYVVEGRRKKRNDIYVTYLDRLSKSGHHYANIYTRANNILLENFIEPQKLIQSVESLNPKKKIGVIIVDDFVGTGSNLVDRLSEQYSNFSKVGIGREIPLFVIVLFGSKGGLEIVRKNLESNLENAFLEPCDLIAPNHFAFTQDRGIWDSEEEKIMAKTLVEDLGLRVQRNNPLGYSKQGLLLTFSRNCPNNSLPILHSVGKKGKKWNPIFPRIIT